MALRINTGQTDFESAFHALLEARREASPDVAQAVAEILGEVSARGDDALIDYTRRFDRIEMTAASLRVGDDELVAAAARCPVETLEALEFAA